MRVLPPQQSFYHSDLLLSTGFCPRFVWLICIFHLALEWAVCQSPCMSPWPKSRQRFMACEGKLPEPSLRRQSPLAWEGKTPMPEKAKSLGLWRQTPSLKTRPSPRPGPFRPSSTLRSKPFIDMRFLWSHSTVRVYFHTFGCRPFPRISPFPPRHCLRVHLNNAGMYNGETLHSFRAGATVTLALLGSQPADIMSLMGSRTASTAFYYLLLTYVKIHTTDLHILFPYYFQRRSMLFP
jgi:hypothetical protein